MSALLLPGLAQEMAASNLRVADSVEAETRRVEKLQHETEEAAASAREAIRHTIHRAPDAQAIWQATLEVMADGVQGEELNELLHDVRTVARTWLTLAEKACELGRLAAAMGAPSEELEELAR